MKVGVDNSKLHGELYAPPSKSYTHRAITIGSLSHQSTIHRPLLSADTEATIRACEMFGASIEKKNNKLEINGIDGAPHVPEDVINVENSGTTLRFMTALATLTDGVTVLTGDRSVRTRPNGPLLKVLQNLGVDVFSTRNNGRAPLVVKGGLKGVVAPILLSDSRVEYTSFPSANRVSAVMEFIIVIHRYKLPKSCVLSETTINYRRGIYVYKVYNTYRKRKTKIIKRLINTPRSEATGQGTTEQKGRLVTVPVPSGTR